jgi:hypothetical protein
MHRTLAVLGALVALAIAPAAAQAQWAPADTATIHPGVQTHTTGAGQCTANFVFTNGADVLIGQAAHCSSTSPPTETNGCIANSLPNGTAVEVDGASRPGTMVYNSWNAMKAAGEKNLETCRFNDFAVIRLDPADHGKVNPSIPFWGGPQGIGDSGTGQRNFTYGNSSLRFGISALSPKAGVTTMSEPGGWSWNVYTASPGVPGDSGSAFLNRSGQALGVLSTLEGTPRPVSNNVSDLGNALAYAQSHGFAGLALANGTEPFSPIL